MAKVMVTCDTATGEMSATIGGKTVENFRDVQMSYYPGSADGKYPAMCSANISTYSMDEDGVRHYGQICAAQTEDGKKAVYCGGQPSKYEDFVNNPNYVGGEKEKYSGVEKSIAAMLKRTK